MRFGLRALIVPLLVPLAAAGQEPVPASPPPARTPGDAVFLERVEVALLEVEIRVEDRSGQRVRGLTAADFELLVDGKPVVPTHFSEVTHSITTSAAAPGEEPVAAAPRWIGVFLDLPTIEPGTARRLVPWLEQLASESDAGIALGIYRGPGSLRMTDATGDALRERLDEALGGVAWSSSRALQGVLNEISRARTPEGQADPRMQDVAAAEAVEAWRSVEVYAQEMEHEYRSTVDAAEVFLARLAGLPGTKVLLYVGDGRPQHPAQAPADAWEERFGELNRRLRVVASLDVLRWDLTRESQRLANKAADLGIPLNALGVSGTTPGHTTAETAGAGFRTAQVEEHTARRHALQLLSEASGGRAFFEPTAATLASVQGDLDHAYVLGFTPPPNSGQKGALAVEVRPRDRSLQARHQRRAAPRSVRETIMDRTLAALTFGESDNSLGARIDRAGPPERRRDLVELPVAITVPMSRLALVAQGAQHVGQLTIFLAAADAAGSSSDVTEVRVPIRVPNDELATVLGQLATYRTRLALKRGTPIIAATVADDLSGAVATALLRLDSDAWTGTE